MTTHLDHQALDSFFDDVGRDREFVLEIIGLYRAQVERFCREAPRAETDDLIEIAHKLAGSSGQLGLATIVEAARRLETALRTDTDGSAELEFLERELPGVVERLQHWGSGLPDDGQVSGSNR